MAFKRSAVRSRLSPPESIHRKMGAFFLYLCGFAGGSVARNCPQTRFLRGCFASRFLTHNERIMNPLHNESGTGQTCYQKSMKLYPNVCFYIRQNVKFHAFALCTISNVVFNLVIKLLVFCHLFQRIQKFAF